MEECNLDHAVFRSWRPRCVKGQAEAYVHKKRGGEGGDVKDDKTKLAMAKVAPSEGAQKCAVEVVRKFAEHLRYNRVIVKSDNESAI